MENSDLFYNKNFCTICYKFTNHDIITCPLRCLKCNGFHKTEDHRCLICNVKNPDHNIHECKLNYNYLHM